MDKDIFKVHEVRYSIDSDELRSKREQFDIKQSTFAAACGWSRSYQQKLENGSYISVSEETANIVSKVLGQLESRL